MVEPRESDFITVPMPSLEHQAQLEEPESSAFGRVLEIGRWLACLCTAVVLALDFLSKFTDAIL